MKRIYALLALFAVSVSLGAPANKTLNIPIYENTATSFVGRAFTVSGNNNKVLGITGGDWALVSPLFGTSPTITTSILTDSTTFGLFNTTATTINAFGAATTLNVGTNAATVLNFGGAGTAAQFRFLEPSGSGTNYTGFKAQAQAGNVTYTLPAADGSSGQVLSTNGSGILSWATGGSGGLTGSAGGNGAADSGKAALFDAAGSLTATTELTVKNASTASHAYLADDGTIGFHFAGETNPREISFPDDVLENEAKFIATRDWVAAQGYGTSGSLTAGYIGYGSAGNSLTGEAAFSYDASTNTATVENIGATSVSAGSLTFEGATADTNETSIAVVDPTADRTFTIPNASGTAILSASDVAQAVDLGGDTSFEVPNGAAPTVDAFGELAGDNNLWAAGRGAPIFYDGTASTALVNVLVSDTPTNGQVPVWNTGGTITWEANGSGSVATDTIFDAKGDLAVGTGANTSAKLTAGTNGYILTADSAEATGLKWAAAGSGSSPTTTRGDLIRRGASADERLAIGEAGAQLVSDGTDAQWMARSKYASWYDEFCWGNATVPVGEIGWNSSGSLTIGTAPTAGHPGLVSLAGASGTTDYCRLYSNVASIALGGGVFRYETVIKTGDLSTGTDEYDLRMGLGDAPGPFTDGVYFEYDRNAATNWRCGVAKAGSTTENEGAAPVAVAANTYYKLAFVVNAAASSVSFYIDGTLLHTIADANVPNTDSNLMGFYYLIVKSAGSALPAFQIDYLDADYTLTTAR